MRYRTKHMIEASEQIAHFVSRRGRADLDSDRMLLFAVVRAVEIVGEAASKLDRMGDLKKTDAVLAVSSTVDEKADPEPINALRALRLRRTRGRTARSMLGCAPGPAGPLRR